MEDPSGSGGWRFAQCFGDKGEVEDITEGLHFQHVVLLFATSLIHIFLPSADIISTVEFDSTGNYLATGDKGGRVVLFERNESVSNHLCIAYVSCPHFGAQSIPLLIVPP
jgi:serine/threonine-protein phosphatase 2A regulatory subunit B